MDVLAYLDAQIASHQALSADAFHQQELPKAQAVRDAVAGLVEAHSQALDFIGGLDGDLNPPNGGYRKWRAALAAVRGAA